MSKYSTHKKTRSILLSFLLIVVIGITAAFAFLTTSDTSENLFTVGSVDVELTEPNSNTIVENVHFSDSLLSLSYYVAEREDEKASKELKNEDE